MASARNLCQHSDIDGTQCTSNDYILCPHCQLQLCLKHLNHHQDLLRVDLYLLADHIDHVRLHLDELIFDSANHRQQLFQKLDDWYQERINFINKIYNEKQQQLQILCLQAHMEFDTYKTKKDKQLKINLMKQLRRVLKQKQINVEDLNEMKNKIDNIERGLDELKRLLIEIYTDNTTMDIHIIKRRYIEAYRSTFTDDDDDNDDDDDDEDNTCDINEEEERHAKITAPENTENTEKPSSPLPKSFTNDALLLSPTSSQSTISSCLSSPTQIIKKTPLKLIIKRLKHPPTSTKVKYELHAVNQSPILNL